MGPGAPPTPTPTPTPHPSASIELRATLYDPDTDRLWIVASGEKIGERTVERVNPHEIEIVGADGRRVLTLADGGVGGGPR